jgi:hypothetical protein
VDTIAEDTSLEKDDRSFERSIALNVARELPVYQLDVAAAASMPENARAHVVTEP